MKTLVIAEKPSVAGDLARALGRLKRDKGQDWYENDEYIISSAIGHLVELFMPEDMDKKLSYWRLQDLPIIPEKFELKPISRTEEKYKELRKLMKRNDVGTVINACDAGREGELIFTYVYEAAKCKKPVQRLWMQSMTQNAILEAFANLRSSDDMLPLQDAARSRSEADWLIGINGTRAFTKRIYGSRAGQVATVGRVQTPTLSIVLEREEEIRNFKPRDYWRIGANFSITNGEYYGYYQKPDWKKNDDEHDRADRLWQQDLAQNILNACQNIDKATVTEVQKRSKQIAPRLYDLTTLQREANGRFGYSASRTLSIAQALYERHKVITYPRTDSRALPEDYIPTVKETLRRIDSTFGTASRVLQNDWVKPDKRVFNNAQISDHFAIIPTGEIKKLKDDEQKLFDMITRRFIATFFPHAEYDETTRTSTLGEHSFKTTGKVLAVAGWLEVYGKTPGAGSQSELPALSPADGKPPTAKVESIEIEHDVTRPPPRYTEATLLSAMEGAGKLVEDEDLADAMKEKGLGTPATRSNIIDHLIREKYMEREGRDLVPQLKAENLIKFLRAVKADVLTQASLTGEWEYRLRQVEEGKLSRAEFMKGIQQMTTDIIERTKNFEETEAPSKVTDVICPTDNKPLLENFRSYRSQDGQVAIYKTIGNRNLQIDEVAELLKEGRIGPLDGFKSKRGTTFSAVLVLDEDFKVKFDFGNGNSDGEGSSDGVIDISNLSQIGVYSKTGEPVYAAPNAYVCARAARGEKQDALRIGRTILEQVIDEEQAKKLLEKGETDVLANFRSKRTKRLFKAQLVLNTDKNGFDFKFPPREPRQSSTTKKAGKKATRKKVQQ